MNKKLCKSILICLVILLVLGALALMLLLGPEKSSEENGPPVSENVITGFARDEVESLSLENRKEGYYYRITQTPGESETVLTVDGENPEAFERTELTALLARAGKLQGDTLIAEHPENLAEYGLDPAAMTLTIVLKDGSEIILKIGDEAPTNRRTYIMDEQTGIVYAIPTLNLEPLFRTKSDLRVKTIFTGVGEKAEGVQGITLTTPAKKTFLQLHRKTEAEQAADRVHLNASFIITAPYYRQANDTSLHESLFPKLLTLEVKDFIEEGQENLARYGLDKPYTIELETVYGKTTLYLAETGGQLYGTAPHIQSVFTLTGGLSVFEINPSALMVSSLWLTQIATVESIGFTIKGESHLFTIKQNEDGSFAGNLDGAPLSDSNTKRFFMYFFSFTIEGNTEGTPKETSPDYQFVLTKTNGDAVTMDFVKINGRQYAAVQNGESHYYVNIREIETFIDVLKKVQAGEELPALA